MIKLRRTKGNTVTNLTGSEYDLYRKEEVMATYIENVQREKTEIVSDWTRVKRHLRKFIKVLSQIVSVDEDNIFKSRDWPYLWPKK